MDIFRTRIARVRLKESGLVIHNFEPLPRPGEEETEMQTSFLDAASDIVDSAPDLMGYVIIAFTEEDASIILDRDESMPKAHFLTMAEHVLRNYERYTAADQEAP